MTVLVRLSMDTLASPCIDDGSFTVAIQRLSLENEKLKSEISCIQRHAETMSHTCSRWDAKYRKLEEQEGAQQERSVASLQEELHFARGDISQAIRLLQRHQSK
ncbi:hypothetical protein BDW62DRAFT_216227 [Aspergillus aurantiobrunneus]